MRGAEYSAAMNNFAPTERTKVRRKPDRGSYDRDLVYKILDEAFVCHVAFIADGMPIVVPTNYVRVDDILFLHGSTASRMIRAATDGPVCLTVTLMDGLVLARSGLEHSVNFRSVMVLGMAERVSDPVAKARHLQGMIDQMFPTRWSQLRPMTAQELKATAVLSLPITEASAKIGSGMPTDPAEDMEWPVWAGVISVRQVLDAPQADSQRPKGPLPVIKRF